MLSSPASSWTRREFAALGLLVFGGGVGLIWLVHPYYDATQDGSIYIVTARALTSGEGYSYLGQPFTLRPPGFPVMIALLLAFFGTNFLALNLFVSLFGIACVALLFCYARPRLGIAVALTLSAVVWLNPAFQRLATQVMSDIPGLALGLACLLVERWARRGTSPVRDGVLGLCIAVATFVRSVNLLLVPAILLSRLASPEEDSDPALARRSWLKAGVLIAVPLALLLPWSLRNAANTPTGAVEQVWVHSYEVGMWHVDPGDPDSPRIGVGDLLSRARERAGAIVPLLGSRMRSNEPDGKRLLLGALALACWAVVLIRRRDAGEFFAGGILLVLLFYFGFRDRLVLPVFVILLVATTEVLLALAQSAMGNRGGRVAVTVLLLASAAAGFGPRAHWDNTARAHEHRSEVAAFLVDRIPNDRALAAMHGPHFSVYAGRPVLSLQLPMKRGGLDRALEILERQNVGAVVIDSSSRNGRRLQDYLVPLHGVEGRFGRRIVVRLPEREPDRP